jgi:hypothetical protein
MNSFTKCYQSDESYILGRACRMDGNVRNGYKILAEYLEGKKLFGRLYADRGIILKLTLCSIIHPHIMVNFSSRHFSFMYLKK